MIAENSLYPHVKETRQRMINAINSSRRQAIVRMPRRTGKTTLLASIARNYRNVLLFGPSKAIALNVADEFSNDHSNLIVASILTWRSYVNSRDTTKDWLLILDEIFMCDTEPLLDCIHAYVRDQHVPMIASGTGVDGSLQTIQALEEAYPVWTVLPTINDETRLVLP